MPEPRKTAIFLFAALMLMHAVISFADDLPDMIKNGRISGQLKMYSYSYDEQHSDNNANDNAVGGIIAIRTGALEGINFGVTLAAAGDLFSDDSERSYGILNSDDGGRKGFAKMTEYYVKAEYFDSVVKYGAQQIDAPFLSQDYSMMFPKTYKALTVTNSSLDNVNTGFYYITDFSNYTENHFENIVKRVDMLAADKPLMAATAKYTEDFGGGANLTATGWGYHMNDVFNAQYLRFNLSGSVNGYDVYVKPSYLRQTAIGEHLGGDFDTYQYGAETGIGKNGTNIKLFYANTGRDDLFTPWGFGEVIIQQYLYSGRAMEKAYAGELVYDCGNIGLSGLTADLSYGIYDTPDAAAPDVVDAKEADYLFGYRFPDETFLQGLNLDAGYSSVNYSDHQYVKEYYGRGVYSFGGSLNGLKLVVKDTYIDYRINNDMNDMQIRLIYSFAMGGGKE